MIRSKRKLSLLITVIAILFILAAYSDKIFENKQKESISTEYVSEDIPSYNGKSYIEINDNKPLFGKEEITNESYEKYSDIDLLGRSGTAVACLSRDLMPTEAREYIGEVHPSGWHTVKYSDLIEDEYLYNRCHLIAYTLSAENANEKNLITGTDYFNKEGMLPFELMVSRYIRRTGNHVMYRVTPIYERNDLLAKGVIMEAYSVEDNGKGIQFCVFVYNVQPGIEINYSNGDSFRKE